MHNQWFLPKYSDNLIDTNFFDIDINNLTSTQILKGLM
jgi:hypothetical protein